MDLRTRLLDERVVLASMAGVERKEAILAMYAWQANKEDEKRMWTFLDHHYKAAEYDERVVWINAILESTDADN